MLKRGSEKRMNKFSYLAYQDILDRIDLLLEDFYEKNGKRKDNASYVLNDLRFYVENKMKNIKEGKGTK